MKKEFTEKEKKQIRKFTIMRRIAIASFISGLALYGFVDAEMSGQGAKNLKEVYGMMLGGILFFAGGCGIAASTTFLRLLRKDKNKAW